MSDSLAAVDPATAVSLAVSIISAVLALVQTARIRNIKLERQRHLWALIASSKALLRHLERQDVHQAYGLASEYFRQLLRDAIILEEKLSIETIKEWRKVGKLSSDWQERQAYMLLTTEEIRRSKASDLPEQLSSFDQPSPGHPVAKQWVDRPDEYGETGPSADPLQSIQDG